MTEIGSQMAAEIAETCEVLNRLCADGSQVAAAASLFRDADPTNVQILARGTSDNAGLFLKYLLEVSTGLPVGLVSPSVVSVYGASLKFQSTALIAISQSGQSPDLVAFATAARAGGAHVIAATNDAESPLAGSADVHVALQAGPEIAVAATKSYSAQLMVSLLLAESISGNPSDCSALLSEVARLATESTAVNELVARMDPERDIVVLGRGLAYANAREAALKIQETCKVSVQAYSIADYLHGPISALNSSSQVLILAPGGGPAASEKDALGRIRAITGDVFWIGSGATPLESEFVVPGAIGIGEAAACLADATLVQRLALGLARRMGLDPDSPEGLSKVTRTV